MPPMMQFLPSATDTVANFKAFGQGVHNALVNYGWVQTSDTGQVDWTTFSSLPAVSTSVGVYELFHASDALQATHPIVIRLEYLNGSASPNWNLMFKVTVGTASNGVGTVLNASNSILLTSSGTSPNTQAAPSTLWECSFNGGPGWFGMFGWRDHSQVYWRNVWCVERSKDTNGNDTADYINFLYAGFGGHGWVMIPRSNMGGAVYSDSLVPVFLPGNNGGSYGGLTPVSPAYPFVGKPDNPLLGLIYGKSNDFSEGAFAQVKIYGTLHTYYMSKAPYISYGVDGTNQWAVGLRWE